MPDMSGYAFCLTSFYFTFPLRLHYITRGYLFERLQETRTDSLKEHEVVFLKRQNLIFSIAAGTILFVFCFRLNIFTTKT